MEDIYFNKIRNHSLYKELTIPYQKLLDGFYKELIIKRMGKQTIKHYWFKAAKFLKFLYLINITDISKVTVEMIQTFLSSAYNEVNRQGEKSSSKYLHYNVHALKKFFNFLEEEKIVKYNPIIRFRPLKRENSLPKSILDKEEVVRILEAPDTATFQGLKERTVLELFYCTGIRNTELRNLRISDLDFKNEILFIREGKGKKDRKIPLGKNAIYWLKRYLNLRNSVAPHQEHLFLAVGEKSQLSSSGVWNVIRKAKRKAEISKSVHPHTLRHCFATHLLEGGAPLTAISALLGHSRIETTKIYTHVEISKLKKMHSKFHPRERGELNELKP